VPVQVPATCVEAGEDVPVGDVAIFESWQARVMTASVNANDPAKRIGCPFRCSERMESSFAVAGECTPAGTG
jgi:hypothetical protein